MQNQQPGKQIGDMVGGRYRIVCKLGSGGMSNVYLAEDSRLAGKRWAVKETRLGVQEQYSFLAEADILVRLNHPNLPEIVDCFPADPHGFSYLVMDYIEGETLLQRFERHGQHMPINRVIEYALQLCDVFEYLHTRKPEPIIYRDVKPANLMIDAQERLRLIDFGIARSFKAGQAADTVRIGTIGFAAPEQFEGRQTDARTDLYGLGALMYFLLSGGQYYYAVQKPLRELDAAFSPSLSGLVEKLLQAEPAARWPSAAAVRAELQRLLAAQPGAAASSREAASGGPSAGSGLAQPPPRIVAVAALYAGAGATFAALAIARALHGLGVRHAVLEPPMRQAELYALLFGEKHAPAGYRCYNEADALSWHGAAAWEDGCTLWLPSSPYLGQALLHPGEQGGPPSSWSAAPAVPPDSSSSSQWRLLLEELERPIVLIDIGSDWQDSAARELIEIADEVVYVVDPLLHKLELASARRNMKRLVGLRLSGKPVYGIANKAVASGHTGQWLSVLPEPPVSMLPAVDCIKMAEASWQGVLVQDRPGVKTQLERALRAWLNDRLRSWLPRVSSKGLLHKLRKNG
jgi:serine/threonine protein kinase